MEACGNLVLNDGLGVAYWATNTNRNPGANLLLQNYGNMFIRSPTTGVNLFRALNISNQCF
jgi:hypothetical protein